MVNREFLSAKHVGSLENHNLGSQPGSASCKRGKTAAAAPKYLKQ